MRAWPPTVLLAIACSTPAAKTPAPKPAAVAPVELRFMEPAESDWREITDPARVEHFDKMADNPAAQLALELYAAAWRLAPPKQPANPTLFIGIKPGGNFARTGFTLRSGEASVSYPEMPFLILDEAPRTFRITFLHEAGHVIHGILAAGSTPAETVPVAPIPHSTAVVTDRRTAFNEGWANHLEAVFAHCAKDAETRAVYDRRAIQHGGLEDWRSGEYYSAAADLRSYAQSFARYWMVRDGLFAFEPAASGDYLRVQLDPARDRRSLRSGGAMVASEGFVASFFFQVVVGDGCDRLATRYARVLSALRQAELQKVTNVPIVDAALALDARGVDVFLDLSRGATVDSSADLLWAQFYDTALSVDRKAEARVVAEIEAKRTAWRNQVNGDPKALAGALGPVVVAEASGRQVGLAVFGGKRPLWFDVNAAGAPIWRLVPGITEEQVQAILALRRAKPFASWKDFAARTSEFKLELLERPS